MTEPQIGRRLFSGSFRRPHFLVGSLRRPHFVPAPALRSAVPAPAFTRLRQAALVVGTAAVLASCGNDNGQNSLHPKGPAAQKIDNLFIPILMLAIAIGIAVVTATVVFAIKFRHREGQPDNPKQIHGSTPLEIGWTIVPALILAVVAVPTIATIFNLAKEPKGPDVLQVQVDGKQWWWQFQLPKQPMVNKKVVTSTELHIPIKTKVYLSQLSDNVIHSFWVPELAGKKDVVPNHDNHNTIEADEPGTYLGACAEYCGLSHADMRFRVIAEPMDKWKQWLAGQQEGPAQPWSGEIKQLTANKYQCTNCHIFNDSTKTNYAPNLTHLASRTTFAGGVYEVDTTNLHNWVLNAPSMIAMQSKDCRLPPPATCVGMPSFTKNTPKGQPVMSQQDADTIVTYLLGEK
jgi:cytochrome c oxidase subunit II